ncbi:protein of unknown function [Rhodovastum atsumiense]|uniref:hypothetical protein n=1 Tax=Rhodovastum atsumiense TaxID=504468 RepID=UPI00139F2B3A|nr:hypothetical protein [Rhodovastum atsumiense]CAH2602592.1 protein of unknown function [Rhodovastum atsumiense]
MNALATELRACAAALARGEPALAVAARLNAAAVAVARLERRGGDAAAAPAPGARSQSK